MLTQYRRFILWNYKYSGMNLLRKLLRQPKPSDDFIVTLMTWVTCIGIFSMIFAFKPKSNPYDQLVLACTDKQANIWDQVAQNINSEEIIKAAADRYAASNSKQI